MVKNAYAHAIPVNQTPAPDSIIEKDKLPSKVIIDFSERPVPSVSTIQVLNEKNERVDSGDFVIMGDHDREAMTTLDTTKLTDGVYTVSWMAQSADDGHIAKGSYVFGIGNVGMGSSSKTSSLQSTKELANGQQNYKVQAITSGLDGLIKWPLILSQITVIGVIFSHLYLWDLFGKKILIKKNKKSSLSKPGSDIPTNTMKLTSKYNKRFTFILFIACITIIISTNLLLFLQIIELVPDNNMSNYVSTLLSLMQGPSGFLWLTRIATAIIIISCIVTYYYFIKKTEKTQNIKTHTTKIKLNTAKLVPLLLLSISFIAGSISIFANSLTSHNAAVEFFPTIAVFLDWIHFMGVSLWIGGLFYISAILLTVIKDITKNDDEEPITESDMQKKTITSREIFSINVKKRFIFNYYLALLLPRFSLIATLSLGVIGISGIYMAWVNIHGFNFLFNSDYGHILIIKLVSIVPLIVLGGYHQLKLHNTIVNIASLGQNNSNKDKSNIIDLNRKKNLKTTQEQNKEEQTESNKINIFGSFSKTIKIESLIAIGVLLVASLLTTTSPPSSYSTSTNMSPMDEGFHTMMMMSQDDFNDGNNIPMQNLINNSYVKEVNILNVTTKLEINPFLSGFNTFKITFTDSHNEPYSNISTVRMIFKNEQADIGPITKKLDQLSPGVYAITGGYISQPGEWNIAMAAQRPSNYDLNYKFTSMINSASSSSSTDMSTTANTKTDDVDINNSMNMDKFSIEARDVSDPFTMSAITLAVFIGLVSFYFYKKSQQKLRKTIDLLDLINKI
ncbi:MAG TPA: CopD family protein [Nitrososphaeraceae archaeon]|nr:CopD family protein [Nitrososphaeraceae archaeon]